jgi:anti-sigma-K factor RskA
MDIILLLWNSVEFWRGIVIGMIITVTYLRIKGE